MPAPSSEPGFVEIREDLGGVHFVLNPPPSNSLVGILENHQSFGGLVASGLGVVGG